MPGLFDALKRGAIDLFSGGGPPAPGVPQGTGSREGLITAGLNILAAPTEDPLEALAIGAMAGRQAGQGAREQARLTASRAGLVEFVKQAGFDREGLTRAYFRALGAGDFETAVPLSEIIKSWPRPEAPERSRRQAPTEVVDPETGERMFASFNPDTGRFERVPDFEPPPEEEAEFVAFWPDSPTGFARVRVVDGQTIPLEPVAGPGGGSDPSGRSAFAEAAIELVPQAFADEGLRSMILGPLSRVAARGGFFGDLANLALGKISDDTQAAAAARDQLSSTITVTISGAQMSNIEREFYRNAFLIRGGDTGKTLEQKRAATILLLERFAGRDISQIPADQVQQEFADIARRSGLQAFEDSDAFGGIGRQNDGS